MEYRKIQMETKGVLYNVVAGQSENSRKETRFITILDAVKCITGISQPGKDLIKEIKNRYNRLRCNGELVEGKDYIKLTRQDMSDESFSNKDRGYTLGTVYISEKGYKSLAQKFTPVVPANIIFHFKPEAEQPDVPSLENEVPAEENVVPISVEAIENIVRKVVSEEVASIAREASGTLKAELDGDLEAAMETYREIYSLLEDILLRIGDVHGAVLNMDTNIQNSHPSSGNCRHCKESELHGDGHTADQASAVPADTERNTSRRQNAEVSFPMDEKSVKQRKQRLYHIIDDVARPLYETRNQILGKLFTAMADRGIDWDAEAKKLKASFPRMSSSQITRPEMICRNKDLFTAASSILEEM